MTVSRFARRRGWRVGALVALPCLIAASTPRYDWSTEALRHFRDDPKGLAGAEPTRAACVRVLDAELPPADRPTPAQAKALGGCDSEALLYGIGRPADPVAARRCDILERGDGEAEMPRYFSGPGILAVVYANGRGAARNLDVATHMACGIDDAVAATEARVAHVRKLVDGAPGKAFGICDDATSGISGGVCAAHDAQLQDQDRARSIAGIEKGWPAARRSAFERAYASMRSYAEAAHELDCHGGTAANDCAIRGAERDLDRFVRKMEALLGRGPWPAVPAVEDRANAATDQAGWARMVADVSPEDRAPYVKNGREVVAARARFERDLLAFGATIPGATAHFLRVRFADM